MYIIVFMKNYGIWEVDNIEDDFDRKGIYKI